MTAPIALITGAAKRIGRVIATTLHESGYNVILHANTHKTEADALAATLNQTRAHSAKALAADLSDPNAAAALGKDALQAFGSLDLLINNASRFYPTPAGQVRPQQWQDLMNSNAMGPYFLSQACLPALRKTQGQIINITDIHAERPLNQYSVYCMSKAALVMMTLALAKELAPAVRVNGVAPGAILWPTGENALSLTQQAQILEKIPLNQHGTPLDIAKAVRYLALDAPYVTGQILRVDGGRML